MCTKNEILTAGTCLILSQGKVFMSWSWNNSAQVLFRHHHETWWNMDIENQPIWFDDFPVNKMGQFSSFPWIPNKNPEAKLRLVGSFQLRAEDGGAYCQN